MQGSEPPAPLSEPCTAAWPRPHPNRRPLQTEVIAEVSGSGCCGRSDIQRGVKGRFTLVLILINRPFLVKRTEVEWHPFPISA